MRNTRWGLMVGVFVVGAATPLCWADAKAGKPAPAFTLSDTQGKTHALADEAGKFVVLEWSNHECPFVRKHYGSENMQQLQAAYTSKGVTWWTILSSAPGKQGHVTPEQANQLTADREARPSAVLLDRDGTVGRPYGAKTTPHMFVIDPQGILIYAGAIDSIPSPDPADVTKATNYVQQTLDAAMAGQPVPVATTQSYGCSVKY